jgi:hypothetical protein
MKSFKQLGFKKSLFNIFLDKHEYIPNKMKIVNIFVSSVFDHNLLGNFQEKIDNQEMTTIKNIEKSEEIVESKKEELQEETSIVGEQNFTVDLNNTNNFSVDSNEAIDEQDGDITVTDIEDDL